MCNNFIFYIILLIYYLFPLYESLTMPSFQNFCGFLAALQTANETIWDNLIRYVDIIGYVMY